MANMYVHSQIGKIAKRRDLSGLKFEEIENLGWQKVTSEKNYDSRRFQIWIKKCENDMYKFKLFSGENLELEKMLEEDGYIQIKKAYTNDLSEEYRWDKEMTKIYYLNKEKNK